MSYNPHNRYKLYRFVLNQEELCKGTIVAIQPHIRLLRDHAVYMESLDVDWQIQDTLRDKWIDREEALVILEIEG